ncbi:MAG: TRAP transporter small permease [Alphaproteobacteria bacterium]
MTRPAISNFARARAIMIRLQKHLLILIAIAMTLVVLYQIAARIGGFSVRWTEEFARFLSIWATFLAVPILISFGRLINIDFFHLAMPPRLHRIVSYLQIAVSVAAFLTLFWVGLGQVQATWRQSSPGLLWPMGLFTLPIVICSVLSLVVVPDWIASARHPGNESDMEKYL